MYTMKIVSLSIALGFISVSYGMFEQQLPPAVAKYQKKENEKREKAREPYKDLEGLTEYKLSDLGFRLRLKHHNIEYIVNFFDEIDVYKKDDESYLIDFHLDGFKSYHLLKSLVREKIKHSQDLGEFLNDIGISIEGKHSDQLLSRLSQCKTIEKRAFSTDNCFADEFAENEEQFELDEIREAHESLKNKQVQTSTNRNTLFQRLGYKKFHWTSFAKNLCSMTFGFALAVPCCYALYLKMGK